MKLHEQLSSTIKYFKEKPVYRLSDTKMQQLPELIKAMKGHMATNKVADTRQFYSAIQDLEVTIGVLQQYGSANSSHTVELCDGICPAPLGEYLITHLEFAQSMIEDPKWTTQARKDSTYRALSQCALNESEQSYCHLFNQLNQALGKEFVERYQIRWVYTVRGKQPFAALHKLHLKRAQDKSIWHDTLTKELSSIGIQRDDILFIQSNNSYKIFVNLTAIMPTKEVQDVIAKLHLAFGLKTLKKINPIWEVVHDDNHCWLRLSNKYVAEDKIAQWRGFLLNNLTELSITKDEVRFSLSNNDLFTMEVDITRLLNKTAQDKTPKSTESILELCYLLMKFEEYIKSNLTYQAKDATCQQLPRLLELLELAQPQNQAHSEATYANFKQLFYLLQQQLAQLGKVDANMKTAATDGQISVNVSLNAALAFACTELLQVFATAPHAVRQPTAKPIDPFFADNLFNQINRALGPLAKQYQLQWQVATEGTGICALINDNLTKSFTQQVRSTFTEKLTTLGIQQKHIVFAPSDNQLTISIACQTILPPTELQQAIATVNQAIGRKQLDRIKPIWIHASQEHENRLVLQGKRISAERKAEWHGFFTKALKSIDLPEEAVHFCEYDGSFQLQITIDSIMINSRVISLQARPT